MFGYVTANVNILDDKTKEKYKSYYCGLCRALGKRHGTKSRITLSYDMTFLAILLSSLYREEAETGEEACIIHPARKHKYRITPATMYAADMNILLTYYKYADDWADDKSLRALGLTRLFGKTCRKISQTYPRQSAAIRKHLAELSDMEKRNELNPDFPAGVFGQLLGEIFVYKDDDHAGDLREFGKALGKFVYILDACLDLKGDIRKRRYNPLILTSSEDFSDILSLLMADAAECFQAFRIEENNELLENILFSGVWTKAEKHGLYPQDPNDASDDD